MHRGARGRGRNLRFLARRVRVRENHRGQSLVEFALLLPILLLLVLIAVDFGRVYLGWINLQNMARIGADFAANNASKDWNDPELVAKYRNQISADASATNCPFAPGQPAAPTFTDMDNNNHTTDIGDRAAVTLVCRFHVITPLISFIVGSDLNVTASSVFPIKEGMVATSSGGGGGGGCLLPSPAINATPTTSGSVGLTVTFRDASGGGAGVTWDWDFGDPTIAISHAQDPGQIVFNNAGTWEVKLTVHNTCGQATTNPGTIITVGAATPPPALCQVPSLKNVRFNSADGLWGLPKPPGAGFTTSVQRAPGAPNGNFIIQSQDIVAGNMLPCGSTTIHVNNP